MRTVTRWRLTGVALLITFAVPAWGQIYSNPASVAIPALGVATPYPSTITVAGFPGTITDLNVAFTGISHTFPDDIDILLVAPNGTNLLVLSDAGGGTDAVGVSLIIDDEAAAAIPTGGPMVSGSFRVSNYDGQDVLPPPAPATGTNTLLSAFDGIDPNGVWSIYVRDEFAGDLGSISGGWELRFNGAVPPPTFAVSPRSVSFPASGPCTGQAYQANIVVSNTGGGTFSLTGAALSGSSAFTISVQPVYPVVVPPNRTITVVFNPLAGSSGPQTSVLTINYDDGAPQVATVNLFGSADAEGAGIAYRSFTADPSCANGVPSPTTSFVDITGHTRIGTVTTPWTDDGSTASAGDDSYYLVNLATAFPGVFEGFRLYGRNWSTFSITSNALITLLGTNATFYGGLPATGDFTIQAGTMDLDVGDGGSPALPYDPDDPGQFPVGTHFGLADVDADADQELVITWFHAYDFGSLRYGDPAARYHTAQLIIYQAPNANEEDYFEIRFPDGNDGVGVPFRRNTAIASGIESDVAVGTNDIAGESAIFRTGINGATVLYPPAGSGQAVRFQPEAQEMATGVAGWRMLGVPVRDYALSRLAGVNLVQGVTGQYPGAADNVRTGYDGTDWVVPVADTDVLVPGRGFLWYLYDLTFDPPDTDGTSNSYALPMRLEGTGSEPALANGVLSVSLHASGNGWNLVANPYRDDLDISGIASWAAGGTLASAIGQMWEPDASTYVLTSTQSDDVSSWQGFMLQNSTATALNVPPIPRTTGVVIIGRDQAPRLVSFELAGSRADNGEPTLDRSTVLYFAEDATDMWDIRDAGKLEPLTDRYATLAFIGSRDGESVLKAQESRELDPTVFEVPLGVTAVGTDTELTLTWPTFDNVPEDWAMELRDLVTGAVVDLRTEASYTFSVDPSEPRGTVGGMLGLGDAPASLVDARFVLAVTSATTGTEGELPTVYALHAPAPNPVVGPSAVVRFDLPEAADATVEVFDMLGRRVATLAEGAREAGRHAARLDAGALSSGVYVVRMRAGDFVQAQRVTISR